MLKKIRISVGYKRSNWSLKILAYNENYCEVRTLRDQGEWRRADRDFVAFCVRDVYLLITRVIIDVFK